MKPNPFLLVLLFAALGCADRDDELMPFIVSIDRTLEEIDQTLLSDKDKENNFIALNRD